MKSQTTNRSRYVQGSLVAFSVFAVLLALWSTLESSAITSGEVLLFTMLVGSLLFPLFVMLHRSLRRRRSAPRVMVLGTMAWMIFSILGAVVNLNNGMGVDAVHRVIFAALMLLFAGMFYASLEQLAAIAEQQARNTRRLLAQQRLRLHSRRA